METAASPKRVPSTVLAAIGAVLTMLIFGANFVGGRQGALYGLSAPDLVTLRVAVSGVLFSPVLIMNGARTFLGIGFRRATVLAVLVGAPYFFVTMLGLQYAPASHAVVLNPGIAAVSGIVLSRSMLGERLSRSAIFGVPLLLSGLLCVAGAGLWAAPPLTVIGDLLFVAAGLGWALFTVLLRRWRVAPVPATAAVSVLSAIFWLPGYAVFWGFGSLRSASAAEVIGQATLQGLLAGCVAVLLYARAVAVLGPARTALFPALVPVFGVLFAAVVLGERLSVTQLLGTSIVGIGIITAAWRGTPKAAIVRQA